MHVTEQWAVFPLSSRAHRFKCAAKAININNYTNNKNNYNNDNTTVFPYRRSRRRRYRRRCRTGRGCSTRDGFRTTACAGAVTNHPRPDVGDRVWESKTSGSIRHVCSCAHVIFSTASTIPGVRVSPSASRILQTIYYHNDIMCCIDTHSALSYCILHPRIV